MLRENTTAPGSFAPSYREQLIGTAIAVFTSGVNWDVIIMFQKQHVEATIENGLGGLPSSVDEPTVPAALKNVVLRHQVYYEVWPEWSGCGGRARRVGYCVRICGVNDQVGCGRGHHMPGCPHCGFTYDEIRKIAEWITLKEPPGCRFEIEPFDRAWHVAPSQLWSRNEIIVTVKIVHSHNVNCPVNDSPERCLNKLRTELKKLGVPEGVWQPKTVAAH